MAQNPKPTKSGMFTNLQSYLRANKGQSGRLAGDIGQNIEKQAQSALKEYETQAEDFGADIEAASITPEAVSSATSFASGLANIDTDANMFLNTGDSDDVVTRIAGLTYTPPATQELEVPNFLEEQQKEEAARIRQGFGDVSLDNEEGQGRFQTALGLGEKAERAAGETETAAGRKSLLEQQFGRPDYTTGEKSFDELLLSGDQEARGRFQGLRQSLSGEAAPTTRIQQGRQELLDRLSQARSSSEALRSQYVSGLEQSKENLFNALEERATNLETERQKAANKALSDAGLGNVPIDQLPEILGLNLSNYIKDPRTGEVFSINEDLTGSQVATSEDIGRLRALYELAGLDPNNIDPAFRGDTWTQQTFGAPELQFGQFEADVLAKAEDTADQIVQATAAQIPESERLSYERLGSPRPLFDDIKYPEMVNAAQIGLEGQLLDIAAKDKELGTGVGARDIEKLVQEGRDALKQSRILNIALGGAITDGQNAERVARAMENYGITESEITQAQAKANTNPVLQDLSELGFRQSTENPEDFNEKFIQPLFNKYAPMLEAKDNPRLTPSAKAHIDKIEEGLAMITSFVDSMEYRQALTNFGSNPEVFAENLLKPAYKNDVRAKLQNLRGQR